MERTFFIALAGCLLIFHSRLFAAQKAVVIVPAADVWTEAATLPSFLNDANRETQVVFGERVLIYESKKDWVRIEALDQPEFTHHQKWEGYPGWAQSKAFKQVESFKEAAAVVISSWTSTMLPETLPDVWLSLGSYLRPIGKTDEWYVVSTSQGDRCIGIPATRKLSPPTPPSRSRILATASQMLGVSYLWGGLTAGVSPPQPGIDKLLKYGVDCSGLVHLSFRSQGVQVPRDSHEQWMKAVPIKRDQLLPADLIFSAKKDTPTKITHVAFYAGSEQILEAPQTGMVVRKVPFKEKYGAELPKVESGDTVGERVIYFGRFIND